MDILQTILLYFIKYVVNRESNSELIMATIFVVGICALPLWTWTSRRLDKRLAYIIGMAFFAAVLLVLINLTPATPLSWILVLCVLAGIGVSAAHVIPWSIIPDAIEYDELKTGEQTRGHVLQLDLSLSKSRLILCHPAGVAGVGCHGYIPNSATQPPSAVLGIRIVTGPIPAVMICIGIVFAILYPLGRERYTQIAQELEERRSGSTKEE